LLSLPRFSPVLVPLSRTVIHPSFGPTESSSVLVLVPPTRSLLSHWHPHPSPLFLFSFRLRLGRHHTYRGHLAYSSVSTQLPLAISRRPSTIVSSPTSLTTGSSTGKR
jgi:hypothetical protein